MSLSLSLEPKVAVEAKVVEEPMPDWEPPKEASWADAMYLLLKLDPADQDELPAMWQDVRTKQPSRSRRPNILTLHFHLSHIYSAV